MAYAALSSLAHTIDLILNPPKYLISVDQKQKIMSIHEYVFFLMIFLEYSPVAEKATCFEGLITEVANVTEDILEYFMWNQMQSRYESTSRSTIGESGVEFEYQLEKATEEIRSIAEEIMHIKKLCRFKDDGRICDLPAATSSSSLTPTGKNDDSVIGLDEDLSAIQNWLCGGSSKLTVIPIVGMGGVGKSTLARNAYDDRLIVESFDVRGWITVSKDYSVDEILSQLLDSMNLLDKNGSGMPPAERVFKTLKRRRYLIVIDDVWDTKAWDDISIILPDDSNGSRIMLTTRLYDVALYADSAGSHVVKRKLMNEKQSWHMLQQKVFTDAQDCPPELEGVGKRIARSCRGLPLAVVLVAGVLSSGIRTRASWEKIAKSEISTVDEQLEKILSLSYRYLPHHLRPSFLYIAAFRKNYRIKVSRLVKLWAAEGLLKKSGDVYRSLEEEAEEYLEDLVKRNLVLALRRKSNGKIKTCSLHDLVRDLCIKKAREEKFLLLIPNRYYGQRNMRRISISHSQLNKVKGPFIHTIVGFWLKDHAFSLTFVRGLRLLRVLDVANVGIGSLPSQLFELFHLRYLALGNPPWKLPAAILKLENLQTLVLIFSPYLTKNGCLLYIPPEIWRMQHLRHLIFPSCCILPPPPDGSPLVLENLQTLSEVKGLICSENFLKMIPNLKKLGILYPGNKEEYHLHNLKHLPHLEKLKLTMQGSVGWQGPTPAFPTTLKKLSLIGGGLPWNDMTIIGSLPNLEVLKLQDHACSGDTWETNDGEFPELKFLLIQDSLLEHWLTEGSHFARLRHLLLLDCPLLREIPDDIGEIPTLEVIEVDDRNKSLSDSAKQILLDQQSYGNDTLHVFCYHYNKFTPRKTLLSGFLPRKLEDAGYYLHGQLLRSRMVVVYYVPHLSALLTERNISALFAFITGLFGMWRTVVAPEQFYIFSPFQYFLLYSFSCLLFPLIIVMQYYD